MPVLYDRQGNAHDVPEEQVAQAIASGKYAFRKGQDVIMRGEGGELYDVPPEEAGEMYQRGYRIETGAELKERELQEEYGGVGGQVATAAHAAGNVLTFGALDYLGGEIGGKEYTDPVRKLKQANPDVHLGAELATIAGSFLVNPASAVGKLTKLPRGVAKIGRGVEKAVLKGLGGAKGGLVRQALAKGTSLGVGAGIEGAAYGGAHFLSEVGLGETEATAENLLANVGMGMMWGGAAGMGLGAGGEILKRGLGVGANFAKRSSKSVVNMWERATGNKAVPGLAEAIEPQILSPKVGRYAKTMGAVIREEPENIARFLQKGAAGKEARRIGVQSAKERDTIIRSLSDDLDNLEGMYEGAAEQMMGKMKIKNMGSIKGVKNEVAAAQEVTALIDDSVKSIDDMLASGDYPGAAGGRLKKVKRSIERHRKDLGKIKIDESYGANLHGITDSLKRDIGKIRKSMRVGGQPLEVVDVANKLDDLYTGFQKHLENPAYYGAVAGAQKEFNAIWTRILGRNKMGRKLREVVGAKEWRDVYATNRGSMEKFVNDLGRAKNQNMEDFFLSQLDDKIAFTKTVRDTFDELPSSLTKQLDKADDLAKKMRGEYLKAHKTVALQNQMGDIIQKSSQLQSILPMGAGAGLGYLLGGEEGLALGLGLSVFTNPGRLIQIRAALDRMSVGTDLKIVKSIKGYLRKATGKVKKPVRGMLAPASLKILQGSNWGDKKTKDETRQKAFTKRSKELTEFLSNPQKTMDRISKNVGDVTEVAPNVAQAMQVKAVQSARYLYDRMPKPLGRDTLITKKFKPSDLSLAKWERIAAVVHDPDNALKSLKAGMLTVEEVDALREIYPRMYERIVVTIAEQVPELREKLPYKEQVQLSILFGVPVAATMEPEFMIAMYELAAPPMAQIPPGQKQPQSKVASGDYDKLNIDKASLTSTQQVAANKLT